MSHDHERPIHRREPVHLADVIEDLLWPHLLSSVRLALRPGRLGLALLVLLLMIAIADLGAVWGGGGWGEQARLALGSSFAELVAGVLSPLDAPRTLGAIAGLVFVTPRELFGEHPVSTMVLPIPIALVWCLGMGALCRISALEFAQGVFMRSFDAVGFARSRFGSIAGAALGPWVMIGVMVLGLAVGGWLLLSWPLVNSIGAVLYPLFLLGALLAVLLVGVMLVGGPMLIPAVVCEGVDGLDAVQRVISLIVANPLRLLLYLLILGFELALAVFVVWLVIEGTILLSAEAAGAWSGSQGAQVVGLATATEASEGESAWIGSLFTSDTAAPRSIVGLWTATVRLGLGAFLLSWYASASTLLFLVLRQAVTGQERTDIWTPGVIEGTMAAATSARAAAGPTHDERSTARLGEHDGGHSARD